MAKLTPMMAQYRGIKSQYEDCILMFRMGDFYEMFFEDAIEASRILQITLTSRSKGENGTPMCGIPFHAVDQYLPKLTRAGKKVAICDQLSKPDGKTIVKRDVVRVVTPGTTFDENILENKANNYLAAIVAKKGSYALAYSDITTGEFRVTELNNIKELEAEISRLNPAECIADEQLLNQDFALKDILKKLQHLVVFPYSYQGDAINFLLKHFEIQSLKGFGLDDRELAIYAAGTLLSYLEETQKAHLKHIQKVSYYKLSDFMSLDAACIRNLEIFYNQNDPRKGASLTSVLDETVSAMGGRMLRNWLQRPLIEQGQIESRLNKVEVFVKDSSLLRDLREKLGQVYDIERLLSRLSLGSGNARDLVAMKKSLESVRDIKAFVAAVVELEKIVDHLDPLEELIDLIDKAIVEEAPATIREGGMIKLGFDKDLDEIKAISTEGKTYIKDLQEREIKRTGINSLKVKFNKVFGYYIEISKSNLGAVPEDYIRKQTLVNAERYIVPELKEYEEKILTAEEKLKEMEYELFYEVRMAVVQEIVSLQRTARAVAGLDVLSTFAFIAVKNDYCKPQISEGNDLDIVNGRHPVVEQISSARDFVPNHCRLDGSQNFTLITGPNMGGKSTYLRQVALIVLMAQIGCYVPAESAALGVIDRIFTRVGASDNLAAGESTFMVEMQEASFILNNATERSLIILDEVGRGTSTYDGVSIAWAMMEFIHNNIKSKTLFATHYHELTELADELERAANMSSAVRENEQEGVVFLYKIVEGSVDKSYGIEVAKLAGLPKELIARARGVLNTLEQKELQKENAYQNQMGLFVEKSEKPQEREHSAIKDDKLLEAVKDLDVNSMTPIEALQKIDELKGLL